MYIGTAVYRTHFSEATLAGIPAGARQAALDTIGGAVATAAQLTPGDAQTTLLGTAKLAFTHAMQVTLLLCAAVAVVTAIGSVLAARRGRVSVPDLTRAPRTPLDRAPAG